MRNIIGGLIVLLGAAFLLDALGVASFDRINEFFWPGLVMLVGVLSFRNSPRAWGGPFIIFLVGAAMLLESLDLPAFRDRTPWEFVWPLFIIIIGAQILLGRKLFGPNVRSTTGQADAFSFFSGVEEKKTGPFDGGIASATFGGVKLDLRDAAIKDGANLQVWAAFGGVDILVPKNVRVTTSVLPIFGGADNKAKPEGTAAATLHVSGTAMFGGVSVKN